MKHYLETTADVIKECQSKKDGLSESDAEARLIKNGKNKLDKGKKKSIFRRFAEQIADPMVLVLLGAATVSSVTIYFNNITNASDSESYADVFIILAVVIINAILGVLQESKAEKAIEALGEMAASTSKVIRDGRMREIKSEELVVGDIIVVEAGDSVPADARIIECSSLKVEEAALTGESIPVEKDDAQIKLRESEGDAPLGDRKNMIYMGSDAVYGRAKAVITATGMNTEMGKIASALSSAEEGQTPLQQKLSALSKILTLLVLGICVFLFLFQLVMRRDYSLSAVLDCFMLSVSLAVAAIPEGLCAVVTIVLSMGVTKMSRQKAIIRRLTAVETLGCTEIICSDKTGTLTQNKMTVVEHVGDDELLLASSFALCSDAEITLDGVSSGDPTQTAVVEYAYSLGLIKGELERAFVRIGEIPFDSSRKLMTTVTRIGGGAFMNCKGLTSITIPSSVTKISSDTFLNCTGLTSVIIPNSVIAIENYAFNSCKGLTDVFYQGTDSQKAQISIGSNNDYLLNATWHYGAATPTITTQPQSVTVNEGKTATFKVVATDADSYQWQYKKPGDTGWTNVSKNGTSAAYSLTTAARHNGYTYRCKVTNAAGSVYTNTVTLTVNPKGTISDYDKKDSQDW